MTDHRVRYGSKECLAHVNMRAACTKTSKKQVIVRQQERDTAKDTHTEGERECVCEIEIVCEREWENERKEERERERQ